MMSVILVCVSDHMEMKPMIQLLKAALMSYLV